MVRPVPRQLGHVRSMVKKPCCARTLPLPEHVAHCSGLEPGSAPVPAQAFARHGGVDVDFRALPAIGVFQRDLEIVAQIAAAVLPPRAPAAHEFAEQIVEHIGEGRREIEAEAVGAAAAAVLERGMAVTIVSGALLIVLQDLIGFRDFLEADFGAVIAVIAVGMMFLGKLAVGGLDLFDRGAFRTAQNFVVIALAHDRKSGHGTGESESAKQIHRFPSPVSVFVF